MENNRIWSVLPLWSSDISSFFDHNWTPAWNWSSLKVVKLPHVIWIPNRDICINVWLSGSHRIKMNVTPHCFLNGSGSRRKKSRSERTCKKCWTSGTVHLYLIDSLTDISSYTLINDKGKTSISWKLEISSSCFFWSWQNVSDLHQNWPFEVNI